MRLAKLQSKILWAPQLPEKFFQTFDIRGIVLEEEKPFYRKTKIMATATINDIVIALRGDTGMHAGMTVDEIIVHYGDMLAPSRINNSDLVVESVVTGAMVECVRQGVGFDRLATLLSGYVEMLSIRDSDKLDSQIVRQIAGMVEPGNFGRFRTTPVIFMNGGSSANAGDIPRLMENLLTHGDMLTADEFAKEFLWIHPFGDGNGRSGWVLYNWANKTLNNPVPLPYFFGEENVG